jgi:hypothetical protein
MIDLLDQKVQEGDVVLFVNSIEDLDVGKIDKICEYRVIISGIGWKKPTKTSRRKRFIKVGTKKFFKFIGLS